MTFATNGLTVPKGQFEGSVHGAVQVQTANVELGFRYGATDWLDLGVRAGLTGLHIDGRFQVFRNEEAMTAIMVFASVGSLTKCVFSDCGFEPVARLAVLGSAGANDWLRFVLGPQLLTGYDPAPGVFFTAYGPSAGAMLSVAIRVWRQLWVMPECGSVVRLLNPSLSNVRVEFSLGSLVTF